MSPMPYGHVSADRLGEAAQTASLDGLRESERHHVEGCQKCRSLFAGYRMADRLLAASWRQTTLPASALVKEPARRRLVNAIGGFAAGFEFRRFAPAAIAILLVFTQLAATAHAMEHLGAPFNSSTHHEQLQDEQACHQCLAFLSIGSALASSTVDFPVCLADHANLITDQIERFIPASTRLFDSRAPPASLS